MKIIGKDECGAPIIKKEFSDYIKIFFRKNKETIKYIVYLVFAIATLLIAYYKK